VSVLTLPIDLIGRALEDVGAIARVARELPERLDTLEARAEKFQEQLDRALALGETIADNSAAMVELGQNIEARGEAMVELGERMIVLGNTVLDRSVVISDRAKGSPTAAPRWRRRCRLCSAPSRSPLRSKAPLSASDGRSTVFPADRPPAMSHPGMRHKRA
jgi:hypothetical protein